MIAVDSVVSPFIDSFIYWVEEREAIRKKKEAGEPWPWTQDLILQKYSFCCVRREDDRVTRWVAAHIREPYADHPHLWWMLCAARQLNWPDTLADLIAQGAWPDQVGFNPSHVSEVLLGRSKRGLKVYTGAYTIRAESDRTVHWYDWPKSRYTSEIVLGRPWEDHERFAEHFAGEPTLQSTVALLTSYRGYGPFMAYQSVVDMRFTRLLRDAPDRESWAAAGPGTIRGLNYAFGRHYSTTVSQEQALLEIRELYKILREKLPEISFDFSDVPNILCETSKWIKVQRGEGRIRSQYKYENSKIRQ